MPLVGVVGQVVAVTVNGVLNEGVGALIGLVIALLVLAALWIMLFVGLSRWSAF